MLIPGYTHRYRYSTRAVSQPSVLCIGSLLIPGYTQVQIQYQSRESAFSTLYRLIAHTRLYTQVQIQYQGCGEPSVPCIGSLLIQGYTQVQIQYQSCESAFSTLYRLTAHTRLHTGTDTVPELWSAFSTLYRLTAHTRLHTGTDTVPEP